MKGAIDLWMMIVFLVIALVALFAISGIFTKEARKGIAVPSAFIMEQQVKACKGLQKQAVLERIELDDSDNDGSPDVCDLCPGGNDSKDTDQDGIPDDCDKDAKLVSIRECKNDWDDARGRCNPT